MSKDLDLSRLTVDELFSLAIAAAEYNIDFFHDWANRMRPFDLGAVEILVELAQDAKCYLETLYSTSERLFEDELPELDADLFDRFTRDVELPGNRYFIISAEEANIALGAALSLQKDAIALLMRIDDIFHQGLKLASAWPVASDVIATPFNAEDDAKPNKIMFS